MNFKRTLLLCTKCTLVVEKHCNMKYFIFYFSWSDLVSVERESDGSAPKKIRRHLDPCHEARQLVLVTFSQTNFNVAEDWSVF